MLTILEGNIEDYKMFKLSRYIPF